MTAAFRDGKMAAKERLGKAIRLHQILGQILNPVESFYSQELHKVNLSMLSNPDRFDLQETGKWSRFPPIAHLQEDFLRLYIRQGGVSSKSLKNVQCSQPQSKLRKQIL